MATEKHTRHRLQDWTADKVVLINWNLNVNHGTATVDPNYSLVYDYAGVMGQYESIADFAASLVGNNMPNLSSSALSKNPDNNPLPWDFAIDSSCYIVFALRQTVHHAWKFQPFREAVAFKQDQTGWYFDLNHIKSDGSKGGVADNACTVCYFSARVELSEGQGTDPFTLYFQFLLGASVNVKDFDPAIKNKGHHHFDVHVATPFDISGLDAVASDELELD